MDSQLNALKQAAARLSAVADRVRVLRAKVEDLAMRARKVGQAQKGRTPVMDRMFTTDLQNARNSIRTFSSELDPLKTMCSGVLAASAYEPEAVRGAEELIGASRRIASEVAGLLDDGQVVHNSIHDPEMRVTAWYLCQALEEMVDKTKPLPTKAQQTLDRLRTPPGP